MSKQRQEKDLVVELKRKAKFMSNMVQMYFRSCEKIVKHNYSIKYEQEKDKLKEFKLEQFVSKHL